MPLTAKDFQSCGSYCSYIDLPEEFTLEENIRMQGKLKPYRGGLDTDAVAEATGLSAHRKRNCVSFFRNETAFAQHAGHSSDASLLIMDEPISS